MTDENPPVAISPIGGDVIAAVVRGGVGSTIGVSSSRGITPVPVAMAVTVAGVAVAGVAVGAVVRGASFDTAKVGLAAAIETTQSCSTIETRCTTRDVTRRYARGPPWRKARGKSGRRTTERRTTRKTRGRTTGTEARRRTGEHRRRTRRRAGQLCKCCIWRDRRGTEQHARREGEKSLHRHCVSPSIYTFDWIAR
jgi:hypothetical protein